MSNKMSVYAISRYIHSLRNRAASMDDLERGFLTNNRNTTKIEISDSLKKEIRSLWEQEMELAQKLQNILDGMKVEVNI